MTPMLPLLMMLGVMTSFDSQRVTFSPRAVLHTPDEIAPAVLPYLACLSSLRGVSFRKVTPQGQVGYNKDDSDCSATRARAKADASKIVQQTRQVPAGTTVATYVESALADIEAYVAGQAPGTLNGNIIPSQAKGSVVAIEDEVVPAYNRYVDCLKTQVSGTSVSPGTVVGAFQQAMSICHGVRDAAVSEAVNALAKKGWDAIARAKAAESTFAAADEQWLTMARQFRDSFVAGTRATEPTQKR